MAPEKVILERLKKKLKKLFDKPSLFAPLGITQQNGEFYLILRKQKGVPDQRYIAKSTDGFSFEMTKKKKAEESIGIEQYKHEGKFVRYEGDRRIQVAYSQDGIKWDKKEKPVLISPFPLEVIGAFHRPESLLLVYAEKQIINKVTHYRLHLAFFDKSNPSTLLWKTETPVWDQVHEWKGKAIKPVGTVFHNDKIICYFWIENEGMYGVLISGFLFDPKVLAKKRVQLQKHITNPILSPQLENKWEAFNTFNPAAVEAGGKVHILYRAQGFDYVSTVGYAASYDGYTIHERHPEPIFTPSQEFERNPTATASYDFMSGGGFGGCEDPRVTLLDDTLYMTYVAFDGWSPPRLALTSILLDDFLQKRWLWSKPVLISPPGIVDKSGCILPEKINGKYVFFHRVFPNILIDYVDDLNFDGKTKWLKGQYSIDIRPDKWDSRKIGAGAPPVKTKDGWLLIYYGVDDKDASKYHIGAMLLDLNDPTKVLYRSDSPILGPTEEYENNGFKPGIAYPCGAIVKDDQLFVYYGGADSVVCVATAELDTFLSELKSNKPTHLHSVSIQEVTY